MPLHSPVRPAKLKHRSSLLHGVSLGALLAAGLASTPARSAQFKSLSQALALSSHALPAAVVPASGVTASKQAALGAQNFARATSRYLSLSQALAAAKTGAAHAPNPIVVDGYGANAGLQAADGAAPGGPLWKGAALPTQIVTAKGITVDVVQNQSTAQLTWKSFSIGAKTTLNFDQSAGGTLASSWVVINTVQDPLANPSEILGAIHAQGKVYVLDRNGIAFGAGSTVNVGSLIAATADIAANQFSTDSTGQTNFSLYGAQVTATNPVTNLKTYFAPTFVNGVATSAITVDEGASIQTSGASGIDGGGYVMLLGGNVANAGLIATPQGQTVLAAGTAFTLRQGTQGASSGGNTTSTTLGSEVASVNAATNGIFISGSVVNASTGLIVADQGDISLVGHALTDAGVLLSTTTVNTRGTIHFLTPNDSSDPTSSITIAPGAVAAILPEDDGLTALDSQRAANIASSVALNQLRQNQGVTSQINPQLDNHSVLADQLGESRVELSTGGSVDVGSGALLLAQGGQIAVGGGSSVLVESGATLDVSGTTNALLPSSMNNILVTIQPFQTRDSAGNRTGALKGTDVTVDARTLLEIASGAYAGNVYTPGGLIEVGGSLGTVPHGIAEWTALGGQVTLQAAQRVISSTGTATTNTLVPGSVETQAGSFINIEGGSVTYEAGPVQQSYVIASDGTIYNVNDAPGNLVYTGVYTGDLVAHPRWKFNQFYSNPLYTPATIIDPSYTVGRDAGSLTVNAGSVQLLGAVPAGTVTGASQDGPRPASVTDPYLLAQTVAPLAGSLAIGNYLSGALQTILNPTNLVFGTSPTPGSGLIDTEALGADGLANITVSTAGSIAVDAPVTVANGGTVSLTGTGIAVGAAVTARSGAILLSDQFAGAPLGNPASGKVDSITLASGATLDTRGVWTNGQIDPAHLGGLGFVNGGTVSILGSAGVSLQPGSRIDVSSGGGILPGGKLLTASGGSISIAADIVPPPSSGAVGTAPVLLDAELMGYGSKGGGTLSLTAPSFQIGTGPAMVPTTTIVLDTALFSSGFSQYVVNGTGGLTVLPGTQVTVAEPIYVFGNGLGVPTGGDPSSAYDVVLPPLYMPARNTDSLVQRSGASITLLASIDPLHQSANAPGGGTLTVGTGATISVDPGQTISLAGYGQTTVLGTLTAHSGKVSVANTSADAIVEGQLSPVPSEYAPGVSVWLGAGSLIDVSGQAAVQTDSLGRRFGLAGSGGLISLGAYPGSDLSTWAQVILRPGAVLDADGAQASVDVVPGTAAGSLPLQNHAVMLAGDGGAITAHSLSGIALDGSFSARAGDAQAAGGTLSLSIDASFIGSYGNIPVTLDADPHQVLVSQNRLAGQVDASLQPGQITPDSTFGLARISQQQVAQGGFGSLNLSAEGGDIAFLDNVSLQTARSITLASGLVGDTVAAGNVALTAPHVSLFGYNTLIEGGNTGLAPIAPAATGQGTLTVQSDLLDFSDEINLGGSQPIFTPIISAPPTVATLTGFAQANFTSTGDIRFLGTADTTLRQGTLLSTGNIAFNAAQLYPTSVRTEQVIAGYNLDTTTSHAMTSGGTILVTATGALPQSPYSVGGTLLLTSNTILQEGVIRAPEGVISLSDGDSPDEPIVYLGQITLAPGSVTSVSLAGQTIPFGGTVDGVTYRPPGGVAPIFNPQVQLQAQSVNVENGATVDLRGGGTLSGAGFVFGRGGSADVLTTPLLDINGGAALASADRQVAAIQPVDTGDKVYAILPGYTSAYAPVPDANGSAYAAVPDGQQITVGNATPGLASGTYTLLPANFALLPGAFRVELTSGTVAAGTSQALGNFTSIAPVTLSVADTGISNAVAIAALITSGAAVRQLAQYNEESYNSFEQQSATQFGAPRPFLPQDAKTLLLTFPSQLGTGTALSFAPSALLKSPDPVAGGYGATVEVDTTADIFVAGAGDIAPATSIRGTGAGATTVTNLVLQDSTLSALDAPRLILGGTLSLSTANTNQIDITGDAASVTIMSHAVVAAGDVMLTTRDTGQITIAGAQPGVSPGGTITTIGAGPSAFDVTNGYYFGYDNSGFAAYPVVDVSNGRNVFVPDSNPSFNASIAIGDGAGVLAGGSLNIVAPANTEVAIGQADLGAKYAGISVAAVNIGSAATLAAYAGQLPTGINLTPGALSTLLNGNPLLGTPAASALTLTATQEVNVLGSVALDSGSTALVLNTPAIYGAGAPGDAASITAPSFTWNGVLTQSTGNIPLNMSATPGGQIAAGLTGVNSGSLSIDAGTIVLGYGPQTQPNDQVQLDRLIAGFTAVTLNATAEITANNKSALSVYASYNPATANGTGGNLSLVTLLLTTDSAAVLKLAAGGALALTTPFGVPPAATGSVVTQGGEIDLNAASIGVDTVLALPSGQLKATAQGSITLAAGAAIDLAGRSTHIFDQTVHTPGGTLSLESTAGSIALDTGSLIDVSSPGNAAGSVTVSALAGEVALDGSLRGTAASGQTGGSFTVLAGTMASSSQSTLLTSDASAFDVINAGLNAGGFSAGRSFEFSTDLDPQGLARTNLTIDNDANDHALLAARAISVTNDGGAINVAGTVDASAAGPGSISLNAAGNLTLETSAKLDASASATAVDSNGQAIDAENRAHVSLTTTAGSLALLGGMIDLRYPGIADGSGTPQGQLVLNAPRVGTDDVAITATGPISVLGAQSIALYAWRSYAPADAAGTIAQNDQDQTHDVGAKLVSIDAINRDNTAFMDAAGANTALAARLSGLTPYGDTFHLRPGVEIDSSAASNGTLTISGDLDLSGLRYSDAGYGAAVTPGVSGSGEAGAIIFRAAGDLIVNGSVTDGFAPPPDKNPNNYLAADSGWVILSPAKSPVPDPLNADIFLPSTIRVVDKSGTVIGGKIRLAKGTAFDTTRPISLNYTIRVAAAQIGANTPISFAAALGAPVTIPAGGFVTTASIATAAGTIPAGTFLAAGTVLARGSTLGPGTVLPVGITLAQGTLVPAGTLLSTFNGGVTLSSATAALPDNAFLPSNTVPIFETPNGMLVNGLELRAAHTDPAGNAVQGYLYPIAQMLPAGSQSWSMSFVAGANIASANRAAILPRSVLDAQATSADNTAYQTPGSLILDDQHYLKDTASALSSQLSPAFSVIRTGTGDLSLIAGANFDQSSLYGIYTAGTQDPLPGGEAANAPYNTSRQGIGRGDVVNGGSSNIINQVVRRTYQAYYPNDGGDVLVAAQGTATGDLLGVTNGGGSNLVPSDAVGNWLWRQGGSLLGQPTAWWVNFGSFVTAFGADDTSFAVPRSTQLVGFQGIGALGGGNVTVSVGLDAGQTTDRLGADLASNGTGRGEGLVIAVGSTGREVSANGTQSIVSTGGGSLSLHVGGSINPLDTLGYSLDTNSGSNFNGALIDLRGPITVSAGAIGRDDPIYALSAIQSVVVTPVSDPRPVDPFTAVTLPNGGVTVVPGDGNVSINTQRDLVLDGVGDAGRSTEQNLTRVDRSITGTLGNVGGGTGFSLWTPATSIHLLAEGGNVTPVTAGPAGAVDTADMNIANDGANDGRYVYPSQLYVTAASGNIAYGTPAPAVNDVSLEISPSANEQVAFLAAGSIHANDMAVDLSGANPAGLSTPFNPTFSTNPGAPFNALTNTRSGGGTNPSINALFALTQDTPTATYLSATSSNAPALFYAANGDIVNFITGETLTFTAAAQEPLAQWYLAAKPARIEASRDIVSSGTPPTDTQAGLQQNQRATLFPATASGDVFLNTNAQSVSVVSAGRDILGGYFYLGGPGLLEVDAGRNITQLGSEIGGVQQLDFGSIKSLGSLQAGAPISLSGGAGISVLAGLGTGADYTAFANLYLNPANQANPALQITDPANAGKVQQVYTAQLLAWLQQNYGYTGSETGALAFFLDTANVLAINQNAFLRGVFYSELLASGQQYNDPNSRFHLSYTRGRQAIGALLPGQNGATTHDGTPQGYTGAITLASGTLGGMDPAGPSFSTGTFDAGIATEHGGDIQVLAPGGQIVLGASGGPAPGGGTGLITNGFGNIDVFAKDSVLLGKSRIFTNAGGNIQIWSAEGDINAGIGARTTITYNPPVINYDNTGGLVDTPAVPTSGAGIATEQPLPQIPLGNIDLTAPLGTIDAGEAGVRSSGNLNLAAARLANTTGFSAGGKTSGNSGPATVSLGAVEAAGAAAGASTTAAQNTLGRSTQEQQPSVIEVEVLSVAGGESEEEKRRKRGI